MSIASVSARFAEPITTAQSPCAAARPIVYAVAGGPWAQRVLEPAIRALGWQIEKFASAEAFRAHPCSQGPGCLVLDITLPGLDGLGLQRRLAADRVHMPIILATGCGEVLMTVQATGCGSLDLVTTALDGEKLPNTVRHAIACSEIALRREQEIQALRGCYASLSGRERQVMGLVVTGLLNKQIGHELGISEITVKAHRGKMMQKMKARSLADLIKMAARLRLCSGNKPL
jgi:FixJ family two-component response regulator